MEKQNNLPMISIIVPVYNVERYLRECLDSILGQTFSDWELLLIDDGSTDEGGRICEEYAKQDARIHVLHQENRGLSCARNAGLDLAKGKYITMVDSDDVLLSREYLQRLYDTLLENDAQISMCGIILFPETKEPPFFADQRGPSVRTDGRTLSNPTKIPQGFHYNDLNYTPGKLFGRQLFDGLRFPEGRLMEDIAIMHRLIYPCACIALLKDKMYGYRIRSTSIIGSGSAQEISRHAVLAYQDRIDFFQEQKEPELARQAEQMMLRTVRDRYKKEESK